MVTTTVAAGHGDLYDEPMAEDHRSLRAPRWLWEEHEKVVDNHSGDLRLYMDWRIHHSGIVLGPDVEPPHDFLATFRVEQALWDGFQAAVPAGAGSADLRSYIWFRVQYPNRRLPSRVLHPEPRTVRWPACV